MAGLGEGRSDHETMRCCMRGTRVPRRASMRPAQPSIAGTRSVEQRRQLKRLHPNRSRGQQALIDCIASKNSLLNTWPPHYYNRIGQTIHPSVHASTPRSANTRRVPPTCSTGEHPPPRLTTLPTTTGTLQRENPAIATCSCVRATVPATAIASPPPLVPRPRPQSHRADAQRRA